MTSFLLKQEKFIREKFETKSGELRGSWFF